MVENWIFTTNIEYSLNWWVVCSVWCGHLLREVNSGNFFFELCERVAFLLCVEEEVKNLNSEQFSNSSVFQVLELTLIGLLLPLIVFSLALFTKSWPISPLYSIYIQKKVRDQNKMPQTHLKSFNGRQWGLFQSISGVSGASGGLRSQNFDFLTQKFKMAVFARFHFLKSKNPISGHN